MSGAMEVRQDAPETSRRGSKGLLTVPGVTGSAPPIPGTTDVGEGGVGRAERKHVSPVVLPLAAGLALGRQQVLDQVELLAA